MRKPSLKAWSDAWNAGNSRALIELYAHDAVVIHPNLPIVHGRAAIKEFFAGAAGDVRSEFLPSEAQFDNLIGYEWGEFRDVDSRGHVLARGTYVVTWVHRDGSWLIKTHAWNDLTHR